MSAAVLRDDPWRRLAWELPAALLLLLVSLAGFLHLLAAPAALPVPPPTSVRLDLVELPPPTTTAASPAPEPPPPPMAEPEPEPPPLPEVTEEEPPPPAPEPTAEAEPAPPPPKPTPPRSRPPEPAKPQTAALPPAAPTPPSPSAALSPSGNMGARALFKPMPEIPEALRHHALDLTALARFRVAASGAAEVELVEPTPDPTLNAALLETLKKWRFFPAMENGKAVASTIDIRIPITVR
jgi:periplasmic protein TonB